MGFFSRKKKAGKAESPQAVQEKEKQRPMSFYIPRYAERDALNCVPGGVQAEELEAFKRANAIRMSRTLSDCSGLPSTNPKMSPRLSRNSSAMSFEWSQQSLSRQTGPFSSRPSSYASLHQIMQTAQPPVPQIPQHYVSQGSSSPDRSSQLSHKRPGSPNEQQRPRSFSRPRAVQPKLSYPVASPLTKSPMTSHEVSPVDSAASSVASTGSTGSSGPGEPLELPNRRAGKQPAMDSPMMGYSYQEENRQYPHDPRRFGEAQLMPPMNAMPTRTYFSHPPKPTVTALPPVKAPPPVKKNRFSFRKSQAIAAH